MKKYQKIILIIISIILSTIIIDTLLSFLFKDSPLLSWKTQLSSSSYVNKGILVNSYYCNNAKKPLKKFKLTKYKCPTSKEESLTIETITDKSLQKDFVCAMAIEDFYEDENYIYQFNCQKSNSIIVKYTSGKTENIKTALGNNHITINDLAKYNITYTTKSKGSAKMENNKINLNVNNKDLTITLENNSSATAFYQKLQENPLTIKAEDYSNFEKVGDLPFKLPTNDTSLTTKPGDLILYQGNKITVYYDENTWSLTKLGSIDNISKSSLKEILGPDDVELTFSIK